MLQHTGILALDLALERSHELEIAAARHRLAREAGHVRSTGQPPRRGRVRSFVAGRIRAFGSATHAVSEAACVAATRIEGRAA
jgi:hypothetical protein